MLALAVAALVAVVAVALSPGGGSPVAQPGAWQGTPPGTAGVQEDVSPSATASGSDVVASPWPTPSVTLDQSATGADWSTVVASLDERRAAAFAAADVRAVASYAIRGSSAWQADTAMIEGLVAQGLRAVGLTTRLRSVSVSRMTPGAPTPVPSPTGGQGATAVVLAVVDERDAYEVMGADGSSTSVPGSGTRQWSVELQPAAPEDPGGPGWRLASVVAGR